MGRLRAARCLTASQRRRRSNLSRPVARAHRRDRGQGAHCRHRHRVRIIISTYAHSHPSTAHTFPGQPFTPCSSLTKPFVGSPGASPTKDGQASPKPAIEAWEIVQALPQLPDGISIQNFLKLFEGRVGEKAEAGRMAKSEWIKMVRENCSYGSDKLLRRKS